MEAKARCADEACLVTYSSSDEESQTEPVNINPFRLVEAEESEPDEPPPTQASRCSLRELEPLRTSDALQATKKRPPQHLKFEAVDKLLAGVSRVEDSRPKVNQCPEIGACASNGACVGALVLEPDEEA